MEKSKSMGIVTAILGVLFFVAYALPFLSIMGYGVNGYQYISATSQATSIMGGSEYATIGTILTIVFIVTLVCGVLILLGGIAAFIKGSAGGLKLSLVFAIIATVLSIILLIIFIVAAGQISAYGGSVGFGCILLVIISIVAIITSAVGKKAC